MPEPQSTPTLPTFSWIGHLKEDDRELLSSYGEFFPGYPGNIIVEEGALQTEVFVVISGELEVHSTQEDGSRILRGRIGPGQTIGEISLFDPAPATATVIASEFSQLWRIADDDLLQFMEEDPGAGNILLRTLAKILSQRLRQTDPAAFGLSAFAVVESPELEEQDAADSQKLPAPVIPATPAEPSATPYFAEEPFSTPPAPVETLKPLPAPLPEPVPPTLQPAPVAPARVAPAAKEVEEAPSKKKTQAFVDPDELEPL
jgi:CRP-like cAMP-binding protein